MPKPKLTDYIKIEKIPDLLMKLTGVTRCTATVYLWVSKGRADQHGNIIKLKATKRLGNLYTTKKWLLDFIRGIGE